MTNTRRWLNELGERFDAQRSAEEMIFNGERMVMEPVAAGGPWRGFFIELLQLS